jgi:pimeloyl-ACP methyl ester carboxylesterase
VTRLVGGSIDAVLGSLAPLVGHVEPSPAREAIVAALNGVLGDHLAETRNPLAISLRFRRNGKTLSLERQALAAAIPACTGKLLVLAHGLCLNDRQWNRRGHDHGAALARDLGCTPVYLHYNTGLHISTNGRQLAEALEALVAQWPVPLEEFAIVAHSMGGLVARSACHYGGLAAHAWPRRLGTLVFLGTPHHGAPMERGGNWIDTLLEISPYTAPFARLGKIRSAGITDLRYGNLADEDWHGRDRFARGDRRRFVPLPENVRCFAIAATTAEGTPRGAGRTPGDGLVPLASALGIHDNPKLALEIPKSRQWIAHKCGHLDLIDRPDVYRRIRQWLR